MSAESYILRVMSGEARGVGAAALRAAMSAAEPVYAAAVAARNRRFDRRPDLIASLPRPVVSVGNLSAGGTGKTPMIRWLAERLRERGHRPAVLSGGYKARPGELGDEQRMLDRQLNGAGQSEVFIRANPDRLAAGRAVLAEHPEADVVLLDDGFQHRRLARDLDIVLINATAPFGGG